MGTNPENLSSAIRDTGGGMRLSDFAPTENLSSGWSDSQQGFHRRARFTDVNAETPIPITIDQETIDYAGPGDDGMIIFHYRLTNSSSETIPDLQFGSRRSMVVCRMGTIAAKIKKRDQLRPLYWYYILELSTTVMLDVRSSFLVVRYSLSTLLASFLTTHLLSLP